ncbi:MAG: hypothetical protein ABI268_10915, partial [Rhodanobacter sp.]
LLVLAGVLTHRQISPLLALAVAAAALLLPQSLARRAVAWLGWPGSLAGLAVFELEYVYRRWRLRNLSHPGLHEMLIQLARHWPPLLQDTRTAAR